MVIAVVYTANHLVTEVMGKCRICVFRPAYLLTCFLLISFLLTFFLLSKFSLFLLLPLSFVPLSLISHNLLSLSHRLEL